MGHKSLLFFEQNMTVLINYYLKKKILPAELQIAKTSLNILFDIVLQTNIQYQKRFRIIGEVEIRVNNRTYDFSLTKCKSKWSQSSIIRNFVRKRKKLPRALRKEKSKKKFKKELKEEMQKDTNEFQWTKKLKALKVYF